MEAHPPSRMPAVALALVVVVAAIGYTALAARVEVPRVHPDELRYALAGTSVAEGEGVLNRGVRSGFGPVHAGLLASVLVVTNDRETAYPIWKALNALLFALSAIPIYLLSRRALTRWWSVAVAALTLAIPSSIYVSVVMTESLSFFLVSWALLAIVLAAERPSVGRQLGAIGAISLAAGARSQFAVLFAALLGAYVGHWLLRRDRPPLTAAARRAWPTLGVIGLVVAAFLARPIVTWSSPSESLGPYHDLWTTYDLGAVAKWTLYHAADLELYLAVIPFAVAPVVLWSWLRQARGGSASAGALAATFVTVNAAFLVVSGAFSSLPYGYDRLHDRYLFYVVPLWLLVFAVWLAGGMPRSFVTLGVGAGLAVVLPALLPFRQLANEVGVDTVPGALWVWLELRTAGPNPVSGRVLLAIFVVGLVAATVLLSRRLRPVLVAAVVVVFAATSFLAWDRMIGAPEDDVFAGGRDRSWIDDEVPAAANVAKLYISTGRCPTSTITWHALFLTEFFNDTVTSAAYIGDSIADGIPIDHVTIDGGDVTLDSGEPFVADYVFTQPGIDLEAEEVARGTNANLVLWRVGGPVRIVNAETDDDVRTDDCA